MKLSHLLVQGKIRRLLKRDVVALNLGCGANLLPDWINVDTGDQFGKQSELELVWDLARGLPFPPASVDYIYHEHFIEHLTREQGLALTRRCYEVLKPGGVLRIACPGLDTLISSYQNNSFQSEEWVTDIATNLIGRNRCQVFNAALRDWGHQYVYDSDDLVDMLIEAGFATDQVRQAAVGISDFEPLSQLETRADSIVVEAQR